MVQGQSVMVSVVGSVTVHVLLPMVKCVASGQYVVKRETTRVVVTTVALAGMLVVAAAVTPAAMARSSVWEDTMVFRGDSAEVEQVCHY